MKNKLWLDLNIFNPFPKMKYIDEKTYEKWSDSHF